MFERDLIEAFFFKSLDALTLF